MTHEITMPSTNTVSNGGTELILAIANAFFRIKSLILIGPVIAVLTNYNKFPNPSNIGYNPQTALAVENLAVSSLAYTSVTALIIVGLVAATSLAIEIGKKNRRNQNKGVSLVKQIESDNITQELRNRVNDFVQSDKFLNTFRSHNQVCEVYTGKITSTCSDAASRILKMGGDSTNDLINSINYYYEISPESFYNLDESLSDFIKDNHNFYANQIGNIKDIRVSQALFLGYLASTIKSPEDFFPEADTETIELAKNMSEQTKTELMEAISRHLLATSYNMELLGNDQGKFAVCYAYDQMTSPDGVPDLLKYQTSSETEQSEAKSEAKGVNLKDRKDGGAKPLLQREEINVAIGG